MRRNGFTLIEVLVALAILAVALAAAMRAASAATQTAGELRLRLLAGWVAENRVAELRALRAWPAPGISEGRAEMVGEALHWRQTVTTTPNSLFRRLEVAVTREANAGDAPLATRVAYLVQP